MTCEDFRKAINVHPLSVTRAVRAATEAHYCRCQKCRDWFDEGEAKALARGATVDEKEAALIDAVSDADYLDPEYREVAEGQS